MMKSTHLIPVKVFYSVKYYTKLCLREMVGWMEFPYPLSLIMVPNLLLSLENLSKWVLVLVLRLVRTFSKNGRASRMYFLDFGNAQNLYN